MKNEQTATSFVNARNIILEKKALIDSKKIRRNSYCVIDSERRDAYDKCYLLFKQIKSAVVLKCRWSIAGNWAAVTYGAKQAGGVIEIVCDAVDYLTVSNFFRKYKRSVEISTFGAEGNLIFRKEFDRKRCAAASRFPVLPVELTIVFQIMKDTVDAINSVFDIILGEAKIDMGKLRLYAENCGVDKAIIDELEDVEKALGQNDDPTKPSYVVI